jgi:hypothetical protein
MLMSGVARIPLSTEIAPESGLLLWQSARSLAFREKPSRKSTARDDRGDRTTRLKSPAASQKSGSVTAVVAN